MELLCIYTYRSVHVCVCEYIIYKLTSHAAYVCVAFCCAAFGAGRTEEEPSLLAFRALYWANFVNVTENCV